MKIKDLFIPKSRLGRYSVFALLSFALFFILSQTIVISQDPKDRPSFFSDPIPAVLLIIAGLSGVFAFFTGTIAVIKNRERAISVFISALIGLFVLFFWLGEVLSPH